MPNLSEAEQHHLVFELNQGADDGVPSRTIAELFAAELRAGPERIAVAWHGGSLSYAELDAASSHLAGRLSDAGASEGKVVALCLERGPLAIVALLATAKASAAYMPIEPTYPEDRIRFMLQDAAPVVVLTSTDLRSQLPGDYAGTVWELPATPEVDGSSRPAPTQLNGPESPAYVMYTSGSTGQPKGVVVPQRAIDRLVKQAPFAKLDSDTRILQAAPIAFDASTFEIWGALLNGGTVVLHDEAFPTPAGLRRSIRELGVTTMWLTAGLFNAVIDEDPQALSGLCELLTGGEALSVPHVSKALAELPTTQLINGYGPTETTTFATCYRIPPDRALPPTGVPIGYAIRQTRLYVLDEELRPVRAGELGELYVGGRGVSLGYLNRDDLTAERFFDDPFVAGERLYKTGDQVRMDNDGLVHYAGRADQQVKIRGFRIELGEIEAALVARPGVARAAVKVIEQAGNKSLCAYLVPADGHHKDAKAVMDALRQSLPDYMVPSRHVWIDEIPITANGKTNYAALPAPELQGTEVRGATSAAGTAGAIAAVFAELLGFAQVDPDANVFDLGANSLLVVRAVTRLRDRVGIEVPVTKVFQYPTPRTLGDFLDGNTTQKRSSTRQPALAQQDGQIAIIGIAGRFPGALSVEQLWDNLVAGKDTVAHFGRHQLDPSIPDELVADPRYVPARGVIDEPEHFDAAFFGITPKEALLMDPQQRLLFEIAWEALESSGYVPEKYPRPIGVFAGKYNDTYYAERVLQYPELIAELGEFQVMVANEKDYVATRLAHRLNLRGPAVSVHTACSTSLVAITMAVSALRAGQCGIALAGGASLTVPINSGHLYQEGAMLSADGKTRTFDQDASGTVFSDGVAMVVLKRLGEAVADGDTIYGVIHGIGLNNDGADKASFTAPSIEGQTDVIAMAQADAGLTPDDIDYVETHGTATPLGDPIEVEALSQAFAERTSDRGPVLIGSLKSNMGHLVIAAGAAGMIKTALALQRELIPPSLHFKKLNPRIRFKEGAFRVVATRTPWPRRSTPRFAGISAFGVGGTNAHVVLGEPPLTTATESTRSSELLVLSARSDQALQQACSRLADALDASELCLADVALTLHAGRREFPFRRYVVAGDGQEAAKKLRQAQVVKRTPGGAPSVLFMFPGQGSQHLGMGAQLYSESSTFRGHVDHCLTLLDPATATRLRELVFTPSPDDAAAAELNQTSLAQPALFIMEYAVAQLWLELGLKPRALIGHSVGEFVAAVIAGVMTLEDAVVLVAERGARMQAQPPGGMLSVRLPASAVEARLTGDLALAADNSPRLSVVAGPNDQIDAFAALLEREGELAKRLHTSHAFHSSMMQPVVEPFQTRLQALSLRRPQIPIISTVTGQLMSDEEATSPAYWADQLRLAVRFGPAVAEAQVRYDAPLLLEVGPRRSLATLARQQNSSGTKINAASSLGDNSTTNGSAFREACGVLWTQGVKLDPESLHAPARRIPLPTYPFERRLFTLPARSPSPPRSPLQDAAAPIESGHGQTFTPEVEPSTPNKDRPTKMNAADPRHDQTLTTLCEILEETSGIDVTPDDADAPFLELGLDSLFLTQFAITVQRKFDVDVTFRKLQEDCPTMATLADLIVAELPPMAVRTPPISEAAVAQPKAPAPGPIAAPEVPAAQVLAAQVPAPAFMAPTTPSPLPTTSAAVNTGVLGLIEQQLQLTAQLLRAVSGGQAQAVPVPAATVAAPVPQPLPQTQAPAPTPALPPQRELLDAPEGPPLSTRSVRRSDGVGANDLEAPPSTRSARTMMKYDVKKAFGAIARIHTAGDDIAPQQRAKLDAFIRRYTERTAGSKKFAQDNREQMADPRVVTGFKPTTKELVYPIVVERSKGAHLWDVDGNRYVDALNGFGLSLFGWQPDFVTKAIEEQLHRGHEIGPQHPLSGETASLLCQLTGFDRAAFCNTGSEAVMGCTRVARTVTGRKTIALFTGAYHGIFDEVLVRGTKKLRSIPAAPGILPEAMSNTLVLPYGTPESLEILKNRADDLAAILVEPIQSRRPDFRPKEFLAELRQLTERAGVVYIFDEVVCGFRLCPGGAQEYYGIKADIASYGKVIGGGLPIGVIAGQRRFMDALDGGFWQFGDASSPPVGVTYFAGTFVRHPLALAACNAVCKHLLQEGPELQQRLNAKVEAFVGNVRDFLSEVGAPIEIKSFASLWRLVYTEDQPLGDVLFYMLRDRGIHIYDGFPCFFTTAHTDEDFAALQTAIQESVKEMQASGFLSSTGRAPAGLPAASAKPPVPGARLGRDRDGTPAWFAPHPDNPKKFVKVGPAGA